MIDSMAVYRVFLCVVSFVQLALCCPVLNAGLVVYIADGSRVGRVDVETGQVLDSKLFPTLVDFGGPFGPFDEGGFTDIAFSPEGQLYGITAHALWKVDYASGAGTRIAQMSGGNLVGIPNALTFGTDGRLFVGAALSTILHTMDVNTAVRTSLGNVPLPGGSNGDFAFVGNNLYLAGTTGLHRFDVQATPPTGTTVGRPGLGFLYGLASPDRSQLFAVSLTSIYSIDPSTATPTFVSSYAGQGMRPATGAAFQLEAFSVVPEPSPFILVTCVAAILFSGRLCMFCANLSPRVA